MCLLLSDWHSRNLSERDVVTPDFALAAASTRLETINGLTINGLTINGQYWSDIFEAQTAIFNLSTIRNQ